MLIWGTRRKTRTLGYVADFCPLCRDVRTFELKRIGLVGHFWYISIGDGELVGFTRTCAVCRTELDATPDIYAQLGSQALPPGQLQPLTFPHLVEHHMERLKLERELKQAFSRLPAHQRLALIKEPFILLSPKVEERFGGSLQFDWQTGVTAAAAFAVLVVVPEGLSRVLPVYSSQIALACVVAGIAAVAVQMFLASDRYVNREVLPALASALRPLKPSAQELEVVLRDMKTLSRRIGSKVKLRPLMQRLQG